MNRITTLIVFLFIGMSASAQNCVADTTLTNQGIYPDSATNIPPAQVGVAYDATITVVVPADTMVVVIPNTPPQLVLIDSVVLVKLLNAPAWASFGCEPPSCGFPGGTSGCGRITGTPPPGEGGKTYEVGFIVTTYGRIGGFPISRADTTDVYYILDVDFGIGQEQTITYTDPVQLFPNPALDNLNVQVHGGTSANWFISDVLGRQVLAGTASAAKWQIPVARLQSGIYFLQVEQAGAKHVVQWVKE